MALTDAQIFEELEDILSRLRGLTDQVEDFRDKIMSGTKENLISLDDPEVDRLALDAIRSTEDGLTTGEILEELQSYNVISSGANPLIKLGARLRALRKKDMIESDKGKWKPPKFEGGPSERPSEDKPLEPDQIRSLATKIIPQFTDIERKGVLDSIEVGAPGIPQNAYGKMLAIFRSFYRRLATEDEKREIRREICEQMKKQMENG